MAKRETATAPAATTEKKAPAFNFVVKKVVTVKTLRLAHNVPLFVQISGKFEDFPIRSNRDPVDGILEPRAVRVVDLTTGELCEIVFGHTLQSVFDESYPDGSYVEKGFRITRIGTRTPAQRKGMRAKFQNDYDVAEIELPK